MIQARYPQPKQAGGVLIREVLATFKRAKLSYPINSHIHCAVSGGCDSVALARLITRYGRKICNQGVSFVHINHGWRGEESDADEKFVQNLAQEWGVACQVYRLNAGKIPPGASWEEVARKARMEIFTQITQSKPGSRVLTAHHADDLAETLLWRLFTGSQETHGGGILIEDDFLLRPLLGSRKALLREFLEEEGVLWREDRTNAEPRFLRSQMRQELMPTLEKLFPKAIQHLTRLGLDAQTQTVSDSKKKNEEQYDLPAIFFRLGTGRIRRAHWLAIEKLRSKKGGEIHLPSGWKLKLERRTRDQNERWVLENNHKKADGLKSKSKEPLSKSQSNSSSVKKLNDC